MGADAEAAIGEFFSSNKWYKDPQPSPSSGLQPKRIERPEAEWDETKWRKRVTFVKMKGKISVVPDKDLLPLEYRKEVNSVGYHNMKMYRKREVECLSWKKYGGPNGLKAAKTDKKPSVHPPQKPSAGKTKSSTSKSMGAKKGTLGSGSGKGKTKAVGGES